MKFKNYTENRDNHIDRHVQYLAAKHDETLQEAARRSLSRIWRQMDDGKNHAVITAFRGEKPLPQNRSANAILANDMRTFGWGFIPILGGFREKIRDDSGEETGAEKDVNEESFFATGTDDKTIFNKQLLSLIKKHEQEAAIIKYHDDPVAHLLNYDGSEVPLGQWKKDSLAQYYTKLQKGPEDRKFTFEAAGDLTRMALMSIDAMFND